MKALVVVSKFPPEYSGPGVRIPRLYSAISNDLGIDHIDVLCSGTEFVRNEHYTHENLPVQRLTAEYVRARKFPFSLLPRGMVERLAYAWENVLGLLYFSKRPRPDYLHVLGTSGLTAAALFWARCKKIPVLQEIVNADAGVAQRFLLLGKSRAPQNAVIVTMDRSMQTKARVLGYTSQIWHRPNPFDETKYKPVSSGEKSARRKAHTPFADSDILIASIGKFIPRKNQVFLVDMLAALPENYKLVLAGPATADGPYKGRDRDYMDSLHKKIRDLGLSGRVHVHVGYVPSDELMAASDIYALPGMNEGFGTPMIEALACGVTVIANRDNVSFAEWLNNIENARLFPLDKGQWAKACLDSTNIPQDAKQRTAALMPALAGNTVIYKGYTDKIRALVGRP